MSFNPYLTTAEQFAEIMSRHEDTQAHIEDNACYSHEVVSTPNGRTYGKEGHTPCDHSVIFYYPPANGIDSVRVYNGNSWN